MQDLADSERRCQASELRHQELSAKLPEATRPLLRQIEAMQARYRPPRLLLRNGICHLNIRSWRPTLLWGMRPLLRQIEAMQARYRPPGFIFCAAKPARGDMQVRPDAASVRLHVPRRSADCTGSADI
jgi:hypothetical protein